MAGAGFWSLWCRQATCRWLSPGRARRCCAKIGAGSAASICSSAPDRCGEFASSADLARHERASRAAPATSRRLPKRQANQRRGTARTGSPRGDGQPRRPVRQSSAPIRRSIRGTIQGRSASARSASTRPGSLRSASLRSASSRWTSHAQVVGLFSARWRPVAAGCVAPGWSAMSRPLR
jgi:hypothetical protein